MNPPTLTSEELSRYRRHLALPEVGAAGQLKLKNSAVLVAGVGGLGSPAALYLAAAGVGRIGLADFDVVDESNLQRQILFATNEVGRNKLQAARTRLLSLNPCITVETHDLRLSSSNALELVRQYDVILDGTDNFPARYLINDACVLAGKPDVFASVFRFEGRAGVFWAEKGPCYRCLHPKPPPPGSMAACAEGGVLGVLPGVIGSLQALEAVKLILGVGKPLIGRMLIWDALSQDWRTLKLRKNPDCPACGGNPSVKSLVDYQRPCPCPSFPKSRP